MKNLNKLHEIVWQQVDNLCGEGYEVIEIAAVLSTAGLSLYRSALNETDYNNMVDNISDLRGKVIKITPPSIN